jgi:tRNA G18 (ribose-2'-O)-methylase SpoU
VIFTLKKFRLIGARSRIKKTIQIIEDLIPVFQSPSDLQIIPTYLDYLINLNPETRNFRFTEDELRHIRQFRNQLSHMALPTPDPSQADSGLTGKATPNPSQEGNAPPLPPPQGGNIAVLRQQFPASQKRKITKVLMELRYLLSDKIQAPIKESSLIVLERDATQSKPLAWPKEIVVVLDHLRSPYNVGAIIRTMECVGLHRLMSIGYTPRLDSRQVQRSAMGCERVMNVEYVQDGVTALKALQQQGFKIYVLETIIPSRSVFQLNSSRLNEGNIALIMGNEEFGVDESIIAIADQFLHIPTFGKKNSLNVSIAFSVAIYQFWSALLGS